MVVVADVASLVSEVDSEAEVVVSLGSAVVSAVVVPSADTEEDIVVVVVDVLVVCSWGSTMLLSVSSQAQSRKAEMQQAAIMPLRKFITECKPVAPFGVKDIRLRQYR